MAKVVVVGGAGLIGSWVADKLLEDGHKVIVFDNFMRGRMDNLSEAKKSRKFEVVIGDVRDFRAVERVFEGADYVVHEAVVRISQAAEDPRLANEIIVDGTFNVLEACVKNKIKKLVFNSSASVYGEPSYLPMDEDHPYNNFTAYGAGKIANEHMARSFRKMYGLNYICFRPFNVYGPRMDVYGVYTEVIIKWLNNIRSGQPITIYGSGRQTLDLVYVEDVAEATVGALFSKINEGVYNIGFGKSVTINKLAKLLLSFSEAEVGMVHKKVPKLTHVSRREAAIEKIRKELKFEPKIDLKEGLRRTVEWHKEVYK